VHDQPYYAWDAGHWRMYALNCEIDCGGNSDQVRWLQQDLGEHPTNPALAYVHEPFFSCSTGHNPLQQLKRIWEVLDTATGQILLSGHNHAFERFALLNADGDPSPEGIRQFVVGTGGGERYPVVSPCANPEVAYDQSQGVLTMQLGVGSYSWRFISTGNTVLDSGSQPVR